MYEVNLSDCDYRNLTVHVSENGTHTFPGEKDRASGRRKLRALIRFFHEPDAPEYVRQWAAKHTN